MPSQGSQWYEVGKSKGTVNQAGTFKPDIAADAVDTHDQPNPFLSNEEWGFCTIGSLEVPGVITSIDGADKPEEWAVQKGTGANHATTVWKGTKLAESIKIVTALHSADAFASFYLLRDTLRPKIGTKPPSLLIFNAAINFNGITRIAVKNIGAPKWVAGGGYWTGEIELIEFNPTKPANAGPADPAKPGGKDGPDPNADVKTELQKALDAAAKA